MLLKKKKNTGQDVKRAGFDLFLVVVLPPDRWEKFNSEHKETAVPDTVGL